MDESELDASKLGQSREHRSLSRKTRTQFHDTPRRLALATLVVIAGLSACGGSTGGSPKAIATSSSASAAPLSTPTTTPASRSCPTAVKVGSALGITLPAPTGVPYSGGTPLPAGATGIVCEYPAKSYNVIIEVITNISPSYIAQFSSNFPVAYTSVLGVGDQARSFTVSLGGGKDNEGVVATKGKTLVAIVATATPASLAQIEALIKQLL